MTKEIKGLNTVNLYKMGKSKELFMDIRINADMSEKVYRDIPDELKDEMKIKRIEAVNFKEIYKKNSVWKEYNKQLSEVIKKRSKIEDEIRSTYEI